MQVLSEQVSYKSLIARIDNVIADPGVRSRRLAIQKVIVSNNGSVLDEDTFFSTALMYLIAQPLKYFFIAKTAQEMAEDLKEIIRLANKVIDQTFRRVIHGKSVPAFEKLFLSLNLTRTSLSRITGKHSMATKFV